MREKDRVMVERKGARSCLGAWGGRASVLTLGTGSMVMPRGRGWPCLGAVRVCMVLWLEAF